jgi:hypothetical protein
VNTAQTRTLIPGYRMYSPTMWRILARRLRRPCCVTRPSATRGRGTCRYRTGEQDEYEVFRRSWWTDGRSDPSVRLLGGYQGGTWLCCCGR